MFRSGALRANNGARGLQQLADKTKHLQGSRAKLENANFVDKAPAEVVQAQRDLVADLLAQLKVIEKGGHTFGARHPWQGSTTELDQAMDTTVDWFGRNLL